MDALPAAICLVLTAGPCRRHELPELLRAHTARIEREVGHLVRQGVVRELPGHLLTLAR